jgi:predicted dehydrogenase
MAALTDPLRLAVIGVGHLGRHHARILSALPGVRLAYVADIDEEKRYAVASATGATPVARAEELLGAVDAVTVAVPTEAHLEVARPFLDAGIGVLVEKPMTRSLAEADALIEAARRGGATLGVGHTERHNPAVVAARSVVSDPRFIEVHRLGTFSARSLDIDVVFDLMIHDLDVVLSLVGEEVAGIEAVGVPVLTPRVDIANARLRFANGCIANVTASRISRDRVRKLRFFQRDTYVSIDYAAPELEVWRLTRVPGALPTIGGGKVDIQKDEPLRAELGDFVDAVREGRAPLVSGEDGRRALALAQRIVERMAEGL